MVYHFNRGDNLKKRTDITKEILEELYIQQRMSVKDVAEHLNAGINTIKRNMDSYGIVRRDREEASRMALNEKPKKVTKLNCPTCNKEFTIKNSLLDRATLHFCSLSCSSKYYGDLNATNRMTGKMYHCLNCGKEIYRPQKWTEKFSNPLCSNECRVEWIKNNGIMSMENHPNFNSEKINCSVCQKEIYVNQYNLKEHKKHYCSVECMAEDYKTILQGENNPNWRGGWIDYYGPSWPRISREVRERDNFTCQRCGKTESELPKGGLHVHHIQPFRTFNGCHEEANRKENLISLCFKCHPYVENNGIDFQINHEGIVQTTTH